MTPLILKMGEQNLSIGRCKFHVNYCPCHDNKLLQEEAHVFAAIRNKPPELQSHGFSTGRSILAGKNGDIVGLLRELELMAEDNLIFKIVGETRKNRKPLDTGGVYIKVRTTGPLTQVSLPLHSNPHNVVPAFSVFGKFDIISVDEARALGVKVRSIFAPQYEESHARSILTIEELAPAVERKQELEFKKVHTDDDKEAMPVLARRRSLRR